MKNIAQLSKSTKLENLVVTKYVYVIILISCPSVYVYVL